MRTQDTPSALLWAAVLANPEGHDPAAVRAACVEAGKLLSIATGLEKVWPCANPARRANKRGEPKHYESCVRARRPAKSRCGPCEVYVAASDLSTILFRNQRHIARMERAAAARDGAQ